MTTKFTEDHEWVSVSGDIATVGITDYAQEQLGDIVFVELPEVGSEISSGDKCGVVESVKAASEIYAPVSGEVTEGNAALEAEPSTVNSDPMGDGWMFKVRLADAAELDALMDEAQYKSHVADLG